MDKHMNRPRKVLFANNDARNAKPVKEPGQELTNRMLHIVSEGAGNYSITKGGWSDPAQLDFSVSVIPGNETLDKMGCPAPSKRDSYEYAIRFTIGQDSDLARIGEGMAQKGFHVITRTTRNETLDSKSPEFIRDYDLKGKEIKDVTIIGELRPILDKLGGIKAERGEKKEPGDNAAIPGYLYGPLIDQISKDLSHLHVVKNKAELARTSSGRAA